MSALGWASDVHLDHADATARRRFLDAVRVSPGDSMLLTGDISVARCLAADLGEIADAAQRPVRFVLGNHDHFGGGIAGVRDAVIALGAARPTIQWLPPAGVVTLDEATALIGVDGWADGRAGDPVATPLVLNDDRLIAELAAQPSRAAKLALKQALADADAARLDVLLARALPVASTIVIATHVPPFVDVLPERGRLAGSDWLPILVCGATGAVIRRVAAANPGHRFEVFAGHTHVAADVQLAANLRCRVMAARYGAPGLVTVQV